MNLRIAMRALALAGLEGAMVALGDDEPESETIGQDLAEAQQIAMWTLVLSFSAVFVVCFSLALYWVARRPGWSVKKVLFCLAPWPVFFRDVDMIVHFNDNYLTEDLSTQNVLSIFIGGLPGYIFCSTYVMLGMFWAYLYYRAHSDNKNIAVVVTRIYVVVNAVIWLGWFIILLVIACLSGSAAVTAHHVEATYAASLNLMAGAVFVVFGSLLVFKLRTAPVLSSPRMAIAQKIGFLTWICTFLFGVRSLSILLQTFVIDSPAGNFTAKLIFEILCELAPTLLIVAIVSRAVPSAVQPKRALLQSPMPA
eukprot:TRINITY_DN4136_c0_g1_i1.p1 TRINITY_DN4136_c0_g1~~TRINITY_DN4136_c0_g1_i1.p1  ORF type:complete len:309 (+),score=92.92 TRINITY_DN4136_c0_g1_i1:137-1063(+)